jgi:hypothetical protein
MLKMEDNLKVEMHLANNESNYNYIIYEGEGLLIADDYDLVSMIKRNCRFENEEINWNNIDADVLRCDIADLQRGE